MAIAEKQPNPLNTNPYSFGVVPPDSYKDRVSAEQRQDRVTALEYASKIQPNDNFRQTAADILRFIETGSFAPPPLADDGMDTSWKAHAEWAPSPIAKPVE